MTRLRPALISRLLISLCLVGCAPATVVVDRDQPTMREIYHRLSPPPIESRIEFPVSSAASTPRDFRLLANPRLHMFVFPHLATDSRVPIPGYWTVFPLYDRIEYALPHEPSEKQVKP